MLVLIPNHPNPDAPYRITHYDENDHVLHSRLTTFEYVEHMVREKAPNRTGWSYITSSDTTTLNYNDGTYTVIAPA